ncbi:hypothetical protein [Clostridium sp. AF32-12BH]|uniref:hypothetical protein n=1 Tax=Clostridium sp. AF32-12BH TaxID=2292006 RepID=UPI000E4E8BE6|nr:hypothetical protein [Clostridium sp. AF32-12BH]RHP45280.1 hypothetical protein DWZ40_12765 [Clostridium sp. AF32-12BH]
MYDYYGAVKEDVLKYIEENVDMEITDFNELENQLVEDLWAEDSVTGNASGSYTFSRAEAQEYVEDNKNLVREMCDEFDCKQRIMENWFDNDYESIDVSLRCYVLNSAISAALEELRETAE